MKLPHGRYTLRAKHLLPIDRDPIESGTLSVENGRILQINPAKPVGELIDLGDVALLPGLVNAHVHLEFSDLASPLGEAGMSLPNWIRHVLANRQQDDRAPVADRVQQGIAESIRHGTTTLGEIATSPSDDTLPTNNHADLIAFRELLGRHNDSVVQQAEIAGAHVQGAQSSSAWTPGLSPHAPYSTHRETYASAIELSGKKHFPLATHLAESREELAFLADGSGPFADLLRERDLPVDPTANLGTTPLAYLEALAKAHRALIVHGNYLNEQELEFLGQHRDAMSLVYCPRTHDFFEHEHYLLTTALQKGVRVVLGTDGRSSNPDLSLLSEMRYAAGAHRDVTLEQILRMGTLSGAEALGLDDTCGSLATGKWANLAVVEINESDAINPYEALLRGGGENVATIYRGELVYQQSA